MTGSRQLQGDVSPISVCSSGVRKTQGSYLKKSDPQNPGPIEHLFFGGFEDLTLLF